MSNIKLAHHNNGKGRFDSHSICLKQPDDFFFIKENDISISSYNLFDIYGYGETKDEAILDLYKKINILFKEYKALETMIFETMLFGNNVLTDNMIEVDCFGKEIVNNRKV